MFIQLTIETPRVTNSRDNQITNKIPHLKKTYQKVKKKKKKAKKKTKQKQNQKSVLHKTKCYSRDINVWQRWQLKTSVI